jgi:hypothetical protein
MQNLKNKIITAILIIGSLLILLFQRGLYGNSNSPAQSTPTAETKQEQNTEPKIVSTNPLPLNEAVILPGQTIEITFNYPVNAVSEFKHRLEPKIDYKIELSSDRKTAKIIPTKTFNLGTGYTLFILGETKFDDKKKLNQEFVYHFRTIDFKGT